MPESLLAIILGIVEGLTEFIPVSSTGHLVVIGHLLGFSGEKAHTFDVFIQLGAILAVVVLYWRRFVCLIPTAQDSILDINPRGFSAWTGVSKLFAATLPALVFGFLFYDVIKRYLFQDTQIACALILGGIVMLLVERRKAESYIGTLEDVSIRQCVLVGLFQCVAMWPGVSRSGSTIVGAMLLGIKRPVAAELSFLMAVPVMCAATGYDLLKSLGFLSASDIPTFAIGFVVSFLTALLAIRFFIAVVTKYDLQPFGWYRIVVGTALLALLYLA